MAVFLHGDVSSGRSADYMLSSAQRFVNDVPGAHAVVLLRPGYFDRDGRVSAGSDCGRRDCYTETVVAVVSAAIATLKLRFGIRTIYALGHSGGSAILGNLIGRQPRLFNGVVLTSCPCDIRAWKPGWKDSLSPLDVADQIPKDLAVIAVTGRGDENTAPAIARRYVDVLKAAGRDATLILIEGTHDYRSVRSAGLEALRVMASR